jgi:hypothetical protein
VIQKVTFWVEVWISPERWERATDDRRSVARLLKDEIESNLESVRGVVHVTVQRLPCPRRKRP